MAHEAEFTRKNKAWIPLLLYAKIIWHANGSPHGFVRALTKYSHIDAGVPIRDALATWELINPASPVINILVIFF